MDELGADDVSFFKLHPSIAALFRSR